MATCKGHPIQLTISQLAACVGFQSRLIIGVVGSRGSRGDSRTSRSRHVRPYGRLPHRTHTSLAPSLRLAQRWAPPSSGPVPREPARVQEVPQGLRHQYQKWPRTRGSSDELWSDLRLRPCIQHDIGGFVAGKGSTRSPAMSVGQGSHHQFGVHGSAGEVED